MLNLVLLGAEVDLLIPLNQPLSILLNYKTVNISGWDWIGQVKRNPESTLPDAEFIFTPVNDFKIVASLTEDEINDLGSLPASTIWYYELKRDAPDRRQQFFGRLRVKPSVVR